MHPLLLATTLVFVSGVAAIDKVAQCNIPFYCPGPLLDTVQSAKLEKDSKYFVDQPTSKPLDQVLAAFRALPKQPTREQVKSFVDSNFLKPGTELSHVNLTDFPQHAPFLAKIRDPRLRRFGQAVHNKWNKLGRVYNDKVLCKGCVSSAIPSRYPFVAPGGRFREFYYWDTYFLIKGLLISGMKDTAKGMIENMLELVNEYGFMPNGARIYYLNRSQPPLLTQMVKLYMDATSDTAFLQRTLPILDKEHKFWLRNRTVTVSSPGKTPVRLAIYSVTNDQPRPESWREDKGLGANMTEPTRREFFANMASGAESGWDYSSRWFTNTGSLASISTNKVVPVDLNSILYMNEKTIAEFAGQLNLEYTVKEYSDYADQRQRAIHRYMWNERDSQWHDFNLTSRRQNKRFYASNIVPLWSEAIDRKQFTPKTAKRLVQAILPELTMRGGVPTSMLRTGEQWDFPNAWPPLQFFSVYALENAHITEGFVLAERLAQRWVNSNYCGWNMTGNDQKDGLSGLMFEKYDVTRLGIPGFGGEYEVQDGFGWTNGVLLTFLNHFGDTLVAPTNCPPMPADFHPHRE